MMKIPYQLQSQVKDYLYVQVWTTSKSVNFSSYKVIKHKFAKVYIFICNHNADVWKKYHKNPLYIFFRPVLIASWIENNKSLKYVVNCITHYHKNLLKIQHKTMWKRSNYWWTCHLCLVCTLQPFSHNNYSVQRVEKRYRLPVG